MSSPVLTLVPAEMLVSQVQKLSLENSGLQLENKLIKDKNNRAAVRVSELESKLQDCQAELSELLARTEEESGQLQLTAKANREREIQQYQSRAASATKEVEILKSEISFLEEQLNTVRKESEIMRQSMDRSKIHEAHKQEVEILKTEVAQLKSLLEESEFALETASQGNSNLTEQLQQLMEIKEVLQGQMEESGLGGSATEKQIVSLQIRLRVTEERLIQERADRAGNLSQIEEKLLSENAKLQTMAKELERQLRREKEKTRTLEQRSSEFREENLRLRLAMPDEDEKSYDIPYRKHSSQRHDNKKPAYDIKHVIKQLESESGLTESQGEKDSLILYLWNKCQDLQQKVKEWKLYLEQLELSEEAENVDSLQSALAIKTEYEAKMQQAEEKFENICAEKITSEQTYKQQLSKLVKERHEAFARLETMDDLIAALRAENDSLRQGLAMTSGSMEVGQGKGAASEGQTWVLHEQIAGLETKIKQLTWRNKVLETENITVRSQLASRDKELTETFAELKELQSAPKTSIPEEELKNKRIQALTLEVSNLKEEIFHHVELNTANQKEKHGLEIELAEVKNQLRLVRKQNSAQDFGSSIMQKQQFNKLEAEIEKKDAEILQLTAKLNESKNELVTMSPKLSFQKKVLKDMKSQMDSLQCQFDERCQVLDELMARENDQLEQFEMVKGMMETLNQRLNQKQGEMDVLQLELQQVKGKLAWMEEKKAKLTAKREGSAGAEGGGNKFSPPVIDLRISEMEAEREELQAQVLQATNASVSFCEECDVLWADLSKAKQEASTALLEITQISSDLSQAQRRLKILEEEKQMVETETDTYKEDLFRLEKSLHETVGKFEEEAKLKFDGFSTEHHDSSESPKVMGELQALRLLIFAKEKETIIMMDKLRHQDLELKNVCRKCELLQEEKEQNRQDVSRITSELVLKIKEATATMGINRILQRDLLSAQKKCASVESQLLQEKERAERRKAGVNEVIRKIEHSEQAHLATSLTLQQKDSIIGDQEVRLRQQTRDLEKTETDRDNLKMKIDQLSEDLRSLSKVNNGLERKLETKEGAINDGQLVLSKEKEEVLSLNHKLEALTHEQSLLLGNYNTERKRQEKLQEEIKAYEAKERNLDEEIAELKWELEMQKGNLVAARETSQQIKAEKETFMKDYHDACRRLGEKEATLQELQKKNIEDVTLIRQEALKQSHAVSFEKATAERELGQLREEIEKLTRELQKKEDKISAFSLTIKELEDARRKVSNLEAYTTEQDKIAAETKILVESLRKELLSVRDRNGELQDTIARKEVVILDLKDQLRSSGQSTETQVTEMKHTIEGMRSYHEFEKKSLREALTKAEEKLRASVQEVQTLIHTKDQLTEQVHTHERALMESNLRLSQETAERKLAEEKLEQLREVVDDMKMKKVTAEEKFHSLQLALNKTEADSSRERENLKNVKVRLKDLESALNVSEETTKAGQEKINSLKAELFHQHQLLENQKQQSTIQLHKMNLEIKQQGESKEKDQLKLSQQAHGLSVDLEQARENLTLKIRENLQLQERVLELEGKMREGESKLRQTQDSLRHEEEIQTRLSHRFEEQESELKKLRHFLAKKVEENGDGKGMWQDMHQVISEMSRQLHLHIETSQQLDKGSQNSSDLVHKLRKQLLETESQLNTERALHAVTRNSMQALEEDCSRLRQTIHNMRRRGARTEKKQKSRMEEINEIIARSQTRVQTLLASGELSLDGSLRNITPSRDYNVGDATFSPDTSFTSDTSFNSLAFLNLSGTFGPLTPRKC